jgi:hypothetical protein
MDRRAAAHCALRKAEMKLKRGWYTYLSSRDDDILDPV